MFNIIHLENMFKVDFIVRQEEEYRKLEFRRKRLLNIGNLEVWVVASEDLIISKLYWTRDSLSDTQLKDVKKLLNLENLDRTYVEKWVDHFQLRVVYEKAKHA